ncbi:hypothetical protein C8R47DRAFT_1218252 [Mycena vitilis]|nr:hypothetical protein C8R47DRAFT_1218252 [Mycena vitilis]
MSIHRARGSKGYGRAPCPLLVRAWDTTCAVSKGRAALVLQVRARDPFQERPEICRCEGPSEAALLLLRHAQRSPSVLRDSSRSPPQPHRPCERLFPREFPLALGFVTAQLRDLAAGARDIIVVYHALQGGGPYTKLALRDTVAESTSRPPFVDRRGREIVSAADGHGSAHRDVLAAHPKMHTDTGGGSDARGSASASLSTTSIRRPTCARSADVPHLWLHRRPARLPHCAGRGQRARSPSLASRLRGCPDPLAHRSRCDSRPYCPLLCLRLALAHPVLANWPGATVVTRSIQLGFLARTDHSWRVCLVLSVR